MVCMYLFIYFILLSLLLCVVLDLDFVTIHFIRGLELHERE